MSNWKSAAASIVWVATLLSVLLIAGVLRHIELDRQAATLAKVMAEERASAVEVVTQAMVLVTISNDDDLVVKTFKPSARRMFRIEADDVSGRPIDTLVIQADRVRLREDFAYLVEAQDNGTAIPPFTIFCRYTGLRADGAAFPIVAAVTILEPASDGDARFAVVIYDARRVDQRMEN